MSTKEGIAGLYESLCLDCDGNATGLMYILGAHKKGDFYFYQHYTPQSACYNIVPDIANLSRCVAQHYFQTLQQQPDLGCILNPFLKLKKQERRIPRLNYRKLEPAETGIFMNYFQLAMQHLEWNYNNPMDAFEF